MPTNPIKAKGICSVCKQIRTIRADGKVGRHKMGGVDNGPKVKGGSGTLVYLRGQCRGANELPLRQET